jgi:adenylate cyclase
MRIGVRFAVSGLVLTSIIVSAAGVHLLWWRGAQQVSQTLANTINDQIVSAVGDEMQSITSEARSAFAAVRTLLIEKVIDTSDASKRQFVFLSQLQAQPTISWVAFGFPDGSFSAAHKLGDSAVEMLDIKANEPRMRVEHYDYVGMDVKFGERRFADTKYSVKDQQWYHDSIQSDEEGWFKLTTHPGGERPAVALAGPIDIDQQRVGVLAIIIELTRVSNFLSQLTVGKSAGAFILDRDGTAIASPDVDADELTALKTNHPLFPVAVAAIQQAGSAYDSDKGEAFHTQLSREGKGYEVVLTPISFPGWSLVTVVPESEFLGPVRNTIRNLQFALAALIVIAGLLSAWVGQRMIAAPLIKVVREVRHIERFDLDKVEKHSSQLAEIENLSSAIADMALGLAAFRKYIPADLVKRLISDGRGARLGGDVRPMSVMFVDMAGFTGMSERSGDRIIPLLSRYFDAVSAAVQANGGTIDKFIGDAVMAFWGAPAPNPDHAVDCCRAALACLKAIRDLDLADEDGRRVEIRIGLNSGDMLVGNIGSEVRLNYTVIGDAVNVASRLESTNKDYGSRIIIGPETRRLAGERILVRELDRLAVYGRTSGLQIYELLDMTDASIELPAWVANYEAGLAAYRARDFANAMTAFEKTKILRDGDLASELMIERCKQAVLSPGDEDWDGTAVARKK